MAYAYWKPAGFDFNKMQLHEKCSACDNVVAGDKRDIVCCPNCNAIMVDYSRRFDSNEKPVCAGDIVNCKTYNGQIINGKVTHTNRDGWFVIEQINGVDGEKRVRFSDIYEFTIIKDIIPEGEILDDILWHPKTLF